MSYIPQSNYAPISYHTTLYPILSIYQYPSLTHSVNWTHHALIVVLSVEPTWWGEITTPPWGLSALVAWGGGQGQGQG